MMFENLLASFIRDEEGATAIEYGLIAALISIIAIVAMTASGTALNTIWTTISTTLTAAAS